MGLQRNTGDSALSDVNVDNSLRAASRARGCANAAGVSGEDDVFTGTSLTDGGSDDTGGGEDAKTRDDDDDEIDEKSENNSVVNPLPTDIAADRGPHDGGGGGGGGGDDAVGGNLDVGSKVVDGEDDDLTST
eukprot:CAMPEP_0171646734 /NCGR_PEP_ID=MMETSP0990-20121206/34971_1 /TAXON_ID=483369 /ORGANISM="non described non described, Strain CCMP2098" /LENGTH=131 /DNA_ID=CAMNT_0012223691 /DNA_START=279 /DNA_END=675 /DNA_ORIENTATION=-